MSDVWISQKRHYCQICNCWLSAHAQVLNRISFCHYLHLSLSYQNIANHEQSERHVNSQRRQLRDMHAREKIRKHEESELKAEIAKIEAAAHSSILRDATGEQIQQSSSSSSSHFERVLVPSRQKKSRSGKTSHFFTTITSID